MGQSASLDFDSYAKYTIKDLEDLSIVGRPPPEVFLVGVAIAQGRKMINREGKLELLFVQRKLDTDYYPGICQLPGGKIESTDINVEAAIKRLVFDKINLKVKEVVHMLPNQYVRRDAEEVTKVPNPEGGDDLVVPKRFFMMNFVVLVEDLRDLKFKGGEYIYQQWIDKGIIHTTGCQEVMRTTARQALEYFDIYKIPEKQQRIQDELEAKETELEEQTAKLSLKQ